MVEPDNSNNDVLGIDINAMITPASERKPLKRKNRRAVKKTWKGALTPIQLSELVEKAREVSEKHGLIVLLQARSGFRISEIANLTIENINFDSREISVEYREETDDMDEYVAKTTSSYRTIVMSGDMIKKLRSYVQKNFIRKGFVFRPYNNSKYNQGYNTGSLINFIERTAKKCNSIGKTIGSHTLRRTFGSMLIQKGIPITTIQHLYGHKTLRYTLIYLKDVVTPEMQEKVRQAMDEIGA